MNENKKNYRVRQGLVVALSDTQIYDAEASVPLTEAEYARHAHQVETEQQYQARLKADTSTKKTSTKKEAE